MKQLINRLFGSFSPATQQPQPIDTKLATAILLIEVSRADFQQDESELAHIRELLQQHLSLSASLVDELLDDADREVERLVTLQHLTRMMNETMGQDDKVRVIELMWRVAYADGEKHHYEEHLLRQVADLLYVSHADFIRARHQAEGLA